MSEIQAMQIIQKVLEKLDRKERERVLTWACSKFADQNEAPVTESAPTAQSHIATAVKVANESRKSEFDIVSSLEAEFEPEDGVSAKYFVRHAKPQTNKVKCLLATYYLQVLRGYKPISIDCIYTFFRHVGWPMPSDLRNSVHQAGKKGYLVTSHSADLQVTELGIDAVENGNAGSQISQPAHLSPGA